MSSVLLIEIRIPQTEHRADDLLVIAEWRKSQGYVVTHGTVRDGLFSASTAARLYSDGALATRAALRVAARLAKGLQS